MKIARIETFLVPPRWLFVRVETADGHFGWGEASLEGHAEAVNGAFEAIRDRFIGADPRRIEDIWQVAYRGGFYRGGPVLMSALAGSTRRCGTSRAGTTTSRLTRCSAARCAIASGPTPGSAATGPDDIAAAAQARKEQGFSAVR
jgi:galactonate dehydratase